MKTTFKILSIIFFISLMFLNCPLYSMAEEETSTQTKDIQILIDDEVINVSIKDIKERLIKGEPVHFVEYQEEAKKTIKSEWITNALKNEYGVEKIDIKNAIITGGLDFHIKDNLVDIEEGGIEELRYRDIFTALITLFAAFGGAWFAFLLQNRKERKREINTNVEALNKVQVTLTQQLNALTNFNKDFIQPYKDHPVSWIAVPAAPHRDYSKLQIDGGSLAFLVEKDSSTIILKLLVVEEKFKEVMNVINLRSNIHYHQLQPKLSEMGLVEGEQFNQSVEKVESLLGAQLVSGLKRLTKSLISNTEDAIQSHEEIIKEIKTTGIKIFSNKRILSFEYINKEKQYNKANASAAKSRVSD